MKVLITGADGFIAKNLIVRLREINVEVIKYTRESSFKSLSDHVAVVDFIFHLAGVNRPSNSSEFNQSNYELTKEICRLVQQGRHKMPILYSSSTQAGLDNLYGDSKLRAENELVRLSETNQSPVYIYRLPNVFGKWSKPNYNSAVATFCYNVINNLPLVINDASSMISLVYIDDVVDDFLRLLVDRPLGLKRPAVSDVYKVSVGGLAEIIQSFKSDRGLGYISAVGVGLVRALYSTYLSFYKPQQFSYGLNEHIDVRGKFVEILKTKEFGQFSFFTAHPGVTRGGHYHHTKNEKFLVLQGNASFKFRNILTDEKYELMVSGEYPEVVETIPGWAHEITNIGTAEMIVMIWANEVFNKEHPDTISYKVS